MAIIKATLLYGDDGPEGRNQPRHEDGVDLLDVIRRKDNTVYPSWMDNPVALARRRVRELKHGHDTYVPCGEFAVAIHRDIRAMHLFIVKVNGKVVLETNKKPEVAAEEVASWIASQIEPKEETEEMSTPSPKAIELMALLKTKGEVALDEAAWGGQLLGALKRMKYVEEHGGVYRLTTKGAERLVEVANEPRHTPRPRRKLFEHEPQPVEQSPTALASQPEASEEAVQSVELHVTDSAGADEAYNIPVLVQYATAAQADEAQPLPSNTYARIEMCFERQLSEAQLFELYPDLGAMVRAIRATGAQVEVCGRVNTDVRGYQHE
jgi:hypothetical protein